MLFVPCRHAKLTEGVLKKKIGTINFGKSIIFLEFSFRFLINKFVALVQQFILVDNSTGSTQVEQSQLAADRLT